MIGPVTAWRSKATSPVVFVPTMGALHEGHASLIRRARRLADRRGNKGSVVVSIFVNPKQFGPKEDLSLYPRPFAEDVALCRREGVDILFHPNPGEMYAENASVTVTESSLSLVLCGASRPGHFDGVCTVVAMLFNIVRPAITIFGEKDWQQLAVIRRMVRDLKIPVKIVGYPTVREEDGLALSASAMEAEAGETSVTRLRQQLSKELAAIPGAEVDYAEIVDESTLAPLNKLSPRVKARALVAVRLASAKQGSVRLIDNLSLPFRS